MKTLFDIQADRTPGRDHRLLLEIGPDYCSYAFLHKPGNAIDGLRYLSFSAMEAEEKLSEILDGLPAADSLHSVALCSAFPEALLVPNRFFNTETDFLKPLHGLHTATGFSDPVPEWQLTTVHGLPAAIAEAITRKYPNAQIFHAFTPGIKIYNGFIADHQIVLQFAAQQFQVLVKKDAAIHLAQIYAYKTPLDVVYYLLKICHEFGLNGADLHLILSGLVEKDSALFRELQQYFQHVHFAAPPEMGLPAGEHPQHYFTSLYNLAACAS